MKNFNKSQTKGVLIYFDELILYLKGSEDFSKGVILRQLDEAVRDRLNIDRKEIIEIQKDLEPQDYDKIKWIQKLKEKIYMKYSKEYK